MCLKAYLVTAIHEESIKLFTVGKLLFAFREHVSTEILTGAGTSQMLRVFDRVINIISVTYHVGILLMLQGDVSKLFETAFLHSPPKDGPTYLPAPCLG